MKDRAKLNVLAWSRASDWWEYKLLPVLAIAYVSSLRLGHSPWQALDAIGWLLLTLLPGAVYVSVLNDLTDREDDRLAGKLNRLSGVHPAFPLLLLMLCLAVGATIAWSWRENLAIVATYVAGWVAYSLYSVPPLRLKKRGFSGVLCDGVGANVVPAILAVLIVWQDWNRVADPAWLAAVAAWSLCWGLRGILWHQVSDAPLDKAGGVQTWIARVGEDRAARAARRVIAPAELLALACLLLMSGWLAFLAAAAGLLAYLLYLDARLDRFEMSVTLIRNTPRSTMLMHEYYDVFLPFALLLGASVVDPRNLIILLAQAVLFPRRWMQVAQELTKLRDPQFESRRRNISR